MIEWLSDWYCMNNLISSSRVKIMCLLYIYSSDLQTCLSLPSPISTLVTSKPVCLYPPYIYSSDHQTCMSLSSPISTLVTSKPVCLYPPLYLLTKVISKPVCLYPPLYLLQSTPNLSVSTLLYVYFSQLQTCLSLPSLISTSINYIFSLANNGNVWSTTRQEALQFCARPATNQAGGRGRIGGAVGGW